MNDAQRKRAERQRREMERGAAKTSRRVEVKAAAMVRKAEVR